MLNEVYDLFIDLDANDEQIDFPVLYAVARDGQCTTDLEKPLVDLRPLFEAIIDRVPAPVGDADGPLQILVTNVRPDKYLGPLAVGRVVNGTVRNKQWISLCHRDETFKKVQVTSLFAFEGLNRVEVPEAGPGNIIMLAGAGGIGLGESLADADNPQPLVPLQVDEPTLSHGVPHQRLADGRAAKGSS